MSSVDVDDGLQFLDMLTDVAVDSLWKGFACWLYFLAEKSKYQAQPFSAVFLLLLLRWLSTAWFTVAERSSVWLYFWLMEYSSLVFLTVVF